MKIPHSLTSIHHSGSSRYVRPGSPRLGDHVSIRLRAGLDAPIEQVYLRTCPDGEQAFTRMHMEHSTPSSTCRWWSAALDITMPVTPYRFMLVTSEGVWWYNGGGIHAFNPTDAQDFRLLADYQSPGWVRSSVFYQVFPDRFADGDSANNHADGEYEYAGYPVRARTWGEPPTSTGRAAMLEFYGGDLPGIQAHLAHIADLGANALYLNPIFTAYTNHRYDVTDYFSVDPHLGGDRALSDLRQALDVYGMRCILDIVPNHCGYRHPWFLSAQADRGSDTAGYFTFRSHPNDYETWLGVESLVKLNYSSSRLREVMYAGQDAVFRHWLRPPYRMDGWRIDVANMLARQGSNQLGLEVSRGIRLAVKSENPHAYLLGENFFDATHQLQGDCWDGVMNYSGFMLPLENWMVGTTIRVPGQGQPITSAQRYSTEALLEAWAAFRAAIPWQVACQQLNLLGSHDTPRAFSLFKGSHQLMQLGMVLLFTYPGVPCIYYGDEIGLGDGVEMNPRQCMSWDTSTWDMNLLAGYKTLVSLRRSSPALLDGGFQVLLAEPDTLSFQRDTDEEFIIVVAHRGQNPRPAGPINVANGAVPGGAVFEELFSHQRTSVENGFLPIPAVSQGAQVWIGRIN